MTDRLHHVFVDQTSEPFRHRTVSAGVLQRGEEGGEGEMLRKIPFPSQLCEDTGRKCKLIPFKLKSFSEVKHAILENKIHLAAIQNETTFYIHSVQYIG